MNENASLTEFFEQYYLSKCADLDEKTNLCRSRLMKKYVFPKFGHVRIRDMNADFINQLRKSLDCSPLSDSSIYHIFVIIRGILKLAVSLGIIPQYQYPLYTKRFPHATDQIRIPPPMPTPSYYTKDEMVRINMTLGDTPLDKMHHLALLTGMKRDELLGLKVSDYNKEAKCLSIRTIMKIRVKGSPSCIFVELPQKSIRRRTIPLGSRAQKIIAESLHDALIRDPSCCNPYLFRRPDGRCYSSVELMEYARAFEVKSGVSHFNIQTLRENFMVCCFREGWNAAEVQAYVGIITPQNVFPYQKLASATASAFN